MIGAISFLNPLLLLALLALPILWILLRAVPPAPLRRRFPAVALLLGLDDQDSTPDLTPWWLLLLRMLAVAALIIGFAGPVLNPDKRVAGSGPLVILMDASWASAQDWASRKDKVEELLEDASQDDRTVALMVLTDAPLGSGRIEFSTPTRWISRLAGIQPNAHEPNYQQWNDWFAEFRSDAIDEFIWVSDGLAKDGSMTLLSTLESIAPISILSSGGSALALRPLRYEDGDLRTEIIRSVGGSEQTVSLAAIGPDPTGVIRKLEAVEVTIEEGALDTEVVLNLPSELRNRVHRVAIEGIRTAGAVSLSDDAIQRRKVALLGAAEQEGGALLSGLHYLRKALVPTAEVIETELETAMLANPDVIIFDDIGVLSDSQTEQVIEWVEEGGTLLRFAGPKLTASGLGQTEEHPLLPVRLRAGGRSIGGAMSWGEPRKLKEFDETSPFYRLPAPADVNVNSQVVAQPDPNLADRVLASLEDGTPLVTAKDLGKGRVILFHVTANAEWSSLPLSGLFVQMLERLAISAGRANENAAEMEGTVWAAEQVLDGFGVLRDANDLAGVPGERLVANSPAHDLPAGVYSNQDRRFALNVVGRDRVLETVNWPPNLPQLGLGTSREQPLKAGFLLAAIALLLADILAALWLSGRLSLRKSSNVVSGFVIAGFLTFAQNADAQEDDIAALTAANNTVLAYVITGDPKVDRTSNAGLLGLSAELYRRTSIEPIEPVGVNIETDALSLYPLIYWPMSETQQRPSDAAIAKLNDFLLQGGMIMFDTRDANLSSSIGSNTPNGRQLQAIARRLDIPRIEPIPNDHVLTRSFYLLQDFPGRYANTSVWVEAAPPDAVQLEGIPFRNLNDGVSPVIIGGNDWAAAWAIDQNGRYLFPVGRGQNGEYQREIAFRFGVNLLMHVMTGNYKSDQVHVPALLDRLGQ